MPVASLDGARISYLDEGAGAPAVVLLHAFPLPAAMWEPQVAALAPRWRVVAPDLRGFGDSEVPGDPGAYSMDAYADDVAALLDHLGLDRVVLGGLSMGGYVAFAVLRRHRRRVAALVLADTRPGADTPEAAERRTCQQRQVAEAGTGAVVDALLPGLLGQTTRSRRPDVVDRVRALVTAAPPAGVIGALDAMKRRPDSTGELTAIDVPTLVVVGDQDSLSPPGVAASMAAAVPGARLEVLPEAGHLSNLEATGAFDEVLVRFLASL